MLPQALRRVLPAVLLIFLALAAGPARASADFHQGSLYRTAGVPAWSPSTGTFTVMLWVWAPDVTGYNDFFEADDGGALAVQMNLGSAADSPTEPYVFTRNGEFHFNKDGSFVANPPQSFDVSVGWTFLAVSFTTGGAIDMYAWQAGVNNGALVHIPVTSSAATLGGSGTINTFMIGNHSQLDHVCHCLLGPLYVYDGVALTQAQIDAQRLQTDPIARGGLIAFSPFTNGTQLAQDGSGTTDWNTRGTVSYNSSNPPPVPPGTGTPGSTSGGPGSTTGSSSGGSAGSSGALGESLQFNGGPSGGAMGTIMLVVVLGLLLMRRVVAR